MDAAYQVDGKTIAHDEEGYLTESASGTRRCGMIAEAEGLPMTASVGGGELPSRVLPGIPDRPGGRVLTKAIGKKLGPEKASNKYLYELSPYGPAKQACKIAGLPKRTGCV